MTQQPPVDGPARSREAVIESVPSAIAVMVSEHPAVVTRLRVGSGIDPLLTLTVRWSGSTVFRASRTASGPATVRLDVAGAEVSVQAWGPGAESAVADLPGLLGMRDDVTPFVPRHRLIADLARRFGGLRLTRTAAVVEVLVPTIIAQKVTGPEAGRSYRALLRRFGEPAPGPVETQGLRVPPAPPVLARQPYHEFHPLGLERRRAAVIIAVCRAAQRMEEAVQMPLEEARRRLLAVAGVGPWTAAEAARLALGDPDAVSFGDYNVPHLVSWALAGEPRGSDERMLELLEPYRGQRARAVRLLELSGMSPPRYGPRLAPRSIRAI